MAKADIRMSKFLSWLLRHGAPEKGITVQPGGWVHVEDVLKQKEFKHKTFIDIQNIVEKDSKQRYALKEEEGKHFIRANQGHSITSVDNNEELGLREITLPAEFENVVHGTYLKNWNSIKEKGLSRMTRNHIHLSPGVPEIDGTKKIIRESCDMLIYIDLPKAITDGFKFYISANDVLLCPGNEDGFLPSCYFKKAVKRNSGEELPMVM